jgi:hypothetical protein
VSTYAPYCNNWITDTLLNLTIHFFYSTGLPSVSRFIFPVAIRPRTSAQPPSPPIPHRQDVRFGAVPIPTGEPAVALSPHNVVPHTHRSTPPPPPIPPRWDARSGACSIPCWEACRPTMSAEAEAGYARSQGWQWRGRCGRHTWSSRRG